MTLFKVSVRFYNSNTHTVSTLIGYGDDVKEIKGLVYFCTDIHNVRIYSIKVEECNTPSKLNIAFEFYNEHIYFVDGEKRHFIQIDLSSPQPQEVIEKNRALKAKYLEPKVPQIDYSRFTKLNDWRDKESRHLRQ